MVSRCVATVCDSVNELAQLRQEKEEQMRDIEGTLVGVLVEQQRQLMAVLQKSATNSRT